MNERIAYLANKALSGDQFPKPIPHHVKEIGDAKNIGRTIGEYLSLQPIEFREREFLCDRYRFFGVNVPSDYYRCLSSARTKYWMSHNAANATDLFYWGWTHVALDYGYILNNGFEAYYRRIDTAKEKFAGDAEKVDFLDGMRLCLDGICNRYRMVGEQASRLSLSEPSTEKREALLRLSDTFTRIPLRPAESFFDAVQFTWLAFLLAPDSLGRIDQYLLPFYRRDLENGSITEDFAFELLEELFIKVHESQADNAKLDISGHNHLVVGGYLQNGEDGWNELSKVVLEAIIDLPTYRPQASFRYTDKTSRDTMRYITEANKRKQLIVFVNDEPRLRGMVGCGFSWEDAVEYTVIGCNEWAITGKSRLDLAHISLLHSVEQAIYERGEIGSYEEFYRIFEEELTKDFHTILDEYSSFARVQSTERNVLTSLFHEDCIENATPFTD